MWYKPKNDLQPGFVWWPKAMQNGDNDTKQKWAFRLHWDDQGHEILSLECPGSAAGYNTSFYSYRRRGLPEGNLRGRLDVMKNFMDESFMEIPHRCIATLVPSYGFRMTIPMTSSWAGKTFESRVERRTLKYWFSNSKYSTTRKHMSKWIRKTTFGSKWTSKTHSRLQVVRKTKVYSKTKKIN